MPVDDVADAADGVLQHVVGMGEGLVLRHVVAQHFEQLFVEHHDQAKRNADRKPTGCPVERMGKLVEPRSRSSVNQSCRTFASASVSRSAPLIGLLSNTIM